MAETDVFKHSSPELYDRQMGPLLFEPYAKYVAERVALLRPDRILETAVTARDAAHGIVLGSPFPGVSMGSGSLDTRPTPRSSSTNRPTFLIPTS